MLISFRDSVVERCTQLSNHARLGVLGSLATAINQQNMLECCRQAPWRGDALAFSDPHVLACPHASSPAATTPSPAPRGPGLGVWKLLAGGLSDFSGSLSLPRALASS